MCAVLYIRRIRNICPEVFAVLIVLTRRLNCLSLTNFPLVCWLCSPNERQLSTVCCHGLNRVQKDLGRFGTFRGYLDSGQSAKYINQYNKNNNNSEEKSRALDSARLSTSGANTPPSGMDGTCFEILGLSRTFFSHSPSSSFFYHFSSGHWRPLTWLNSWSISSFVALNMNCLLGYLNAARSLSESGVATILDLRDSHVEFWVS